MTLKKFFTVGLIPSLIFILLGVTPLLQAQNQQGYEYPKVLFFIALVVIILIANEITPAKNRLKLFSRSIVSLFGLLFVSSLCISSLFQPHITQSFLGQYPYYQGVIVYFLLFVFFLVIGSLSVSLERYSYVFVGSAVLIAAFSIVQWVELHVFHMPIGTYSGRVVSTFGQPNLYGGYLAIVLPLFFFLLEKAKAMQRTLLVSLFTIVFLGIAVSESRLAFALVGIGGVVGILVFLKKTAYFMKAYVVCIILGVLFAIITIPRLIQTELVDPFNYSWLKYNNPEKRVYIWQVALLQGIKKPILGFGVDTFRQVYTSYFDTAPKDASYYSRRVLVVDRAHNYLLDIFVYAGGVGVGLYICLIVTMFIGLKKEKWLFLSLVLYLLFVLLHPQSIMQLIYFWFLAGMAQKKS